MQANVLCKGFATDRKLFLSSPSVTRGLPRKQSSGNEQRADQFEKGTAIRSN